jgi:hypothetical protein
MKLRKAHRSGNSVAARDAAAALSTDIHKGKIAVNSVVQQTLTIAGMAIETVFSKSSIHALRDTRRAAAACLEKTPFLLRTARRR